MTDRDVARSERILDKIGSRLGLTPEGKEWLICVTDPFHDTPLNVCGYPDTYEAASVVQTVKCSANIAVPDGIEGNWDCHIHNFPWLLPPPVWLGNVNNPILGTNSGYGNVQLNPSFTAANTVWGGLSVCSVAAGAVTYDTGASSTAIPTQPLYTQIKPYLTGEYRIIGMGWEVINTTSDLNIQGLVTCYRQPSPSVTNASTVYMSSLTGTPPTAPAIGWIPVIYDKAPPQNPGTALLLDGSKQWKAKEGCYVVSTLNSEEILTSGNMTSYVVNLAATDTAISSYNSCVIGLETSQITATPPTSSTTTFYAIAPGCCLPTQFNASGAYFTGLSNSTTLTLNAVYFIERFPTQNESDLVVLAKHSCRYDPTALDLYGEIIRSMPVGVPQRMNGFGDWFADAVSTASDFISPVLSAIPIPGAGAVGMAVKAAGNVAKSLQSKKESVATYAPTGSNTAVVVAQPKKKTKPAVKAKKKK